MGHKKKWLIVFIISTLSFIGFISYMVAGSGHGFNQNILNSVSSNQTTLPLPEVLKDQDSDPDISEFHLIAQTGFSEFLEGKKTDTFGYNGNYLGPVIRVKRGQEVNIKVKNELGEPTTVHWHGLEVSGESDGGPHTEIMPGQVWKPSFTVDQPAATLWYHPHLLHKTGEQVYRGLAGLFYIDDDATSELDIPNNYGKNDFPLIIQDRNFESDGKMPYKVGMRDLMFGLLGDTVMVNGAINPQLSVPRGKVRFRILNGSNARIYNFHLSDNYPFYQIASDGGLLEAPIKMNEVKLSPAERAEIIVDFSSFEAGHQLAFQSDGAPILSFVVEGDLEKETELPKTLAKIDEIPVSDASRVRTFAFTGMGPMVSINGKQMNIERIDEKVPLNAVEIWEVSNTTMGMSMGRNGEIAHPFHAHGVQFQILDRDGMKPAPNEQGWKDTFLVNSGETVRVIARFKYPGIFMYHCHILEHEDAGMMGQFLVE